jgi:hypothetical protein
MVISIDGVQTTITQYVSLYNSQGYVFVGSATASVAHQDNGKKSITIQVTGGHSEYDLYIHLTFQNGHT